MEVSLCSLSCQSKLFLSWSSWEDMLPTVNEYQIVVEYLIAEREHWSTIQWTKSHWSNAGLIAVYSHARLIYILKVYHWKIWSTQSSTWFNCVIYKMHK